MNDESEVNMLSRAAHAQAEPVHLKTRIEIAEHFQDLQANGEVKNWRVAAATLYSGTTDKKSHEYKAAIRQFQYDAKAGRERYLSEKVLPATKARYEEVGKQLPPDHYNPTGPVTVTVKGTQNNGDRDREWTTTFTGSDAYGFVNNPNYRDFFKRLGYKDDVIDRFEGGDSSGLAVMSVS